MIKTEVLVVGAGISGPVAALKSSKGGLNTLLINDNKKIGNQAKTRIDITESAGIEDIIAELNLKILDKSNRSRWFSPNKSFLLESKIEDIYVKRGPDTDSFENSTINSAEDYGCQIKSGCRLIDINLKDDNVSSLVFKRGSNREEIKADIVIDATGYHSLLSKKVNSSADSVVNTKFSLFGVTGKEFNIEKRISHIFFDIKRIPRGYLYIGKTTSGLGTAAMLCENITSYASVKKYFDTYVKHDKRVFSILSKASEKSYFKGGYISSELNSRQKWNLLLVGDAGRLSDPFFGYGVRSAILSGYTSALIAKKFLSSEIKSLDEYNKEINKQLLKNRKIMVFLRKYFNKMDNSDFDIIVDSLNYISKKSNVDNFLENPYTNLSLLLKVIARHPLGFLKLIPKIPIL